MAQLLLNLDEKILTNSTAVDGLVSKLKGPIGKCRVDLAGMFQLNAHLVKQILYLLHCLKKLGATVSLTGLHQDVHDILQCTEVAQEAELVEL